MATEVSNIDDVLMDTVATSTTPMPPETAYEEPEENSDESYEDVAPSTQDENQEELSNDAEEEEVSVEKEQEYDDYGNVKKPPKTYTQEEVNEMFRKRFKNQHQEGQQQQAQQQQTQIPGKEFQYNQDSEDSWQTQLQQFVEQTVSQMNQKQLQQQQQQKEAQAQMEFESKFTEGMERFNDFREVVGAQPIDDPMTYALRGMNDPAAFIYAAAKRHPSELQRISNIGDPYAKMVEMGKLEERMRKTPIATKAPRPISRAREDGAMPVSQKPKDPTIEDLIARSDAKRRAQLVAKRGR